MRKLTLEGVKEKLKNINSTIEILSDVYEGGHKKLKCKCTIDGNEWEAAASSLLAGHGCPKCKGVSISKKKASGIDSVINSLALINPNIQIVSREYKNNKTKLMCVCVVCGNTWTACANNLLMGKGCPKCAIKQTAEKQKCSLLDVVNKIKTVNPAVIVLSQKYSGASLKLKVQCAVCNHTWHASANNLKRGYGCPKCNASKGEKRIEQWLRDNNIKYQTQYRIDECRYKKPLPFDFAVFNNDKLSCLIEYQGIQHYRINSYYGGADAYKYLKNNDGIKKQYCNDKGIHLVEIPYTEKNIHEKLDKTVNYCGRR